MKQLAWTLPFLVVAVGCDGITNPIDTVRNDVIEDDTGITIASIQLRARGEDETELSFAPSGDFGSNILGGSLAGASNLGTDCNSDDDCPMDAGDTVNRCVGGTCYAYTETSVGEIDCEIYDVQISDASGNTCSYIVNDGETDVSGQACTTADDCGGPFRCIDGACQFEYSGDGLFLCFAAARWDLATAIPGSQCDDLAP